MPFLNLDLRLETLAEVGHGDDTGEVSLPYRLPFDSLTSLRYLRLHTDGGAPAQDAPGPRPASLPDPYGTDSGWDGGMTRWPVGPASTPQSDWHRRIPAPHARLAPPDRPLGRCPTERTTQHLGLARWHTLTPKAVEQQTLDHAVCLLSGATGASLKKPVGLQEGGALQIFSWDALEAFLRRFERSNLARGTFMSPTSGKQMSLSALRRLVVVQP